MSTPSIDINPVTTPQPPVGASKQPTDNNLAFDPAYDSTLTFDATKPPSVGFEPSAYPGNDAVTQMLLILDQLKKNPSNTTDAQLFLLYTSGLVQNGMIDQPLTAPDGSITTLDKLIASIGITKDGSNDPESLIACAIDIAFQEKYAQEVEAGNAKTWNPTVGSNGQPSFCDYLHSLFPPNENGEYFKVAQQANDEIDNWASSWTNYQNENENKTADELRLEASNDWKEDIENSNISIVETELRVDIVHSASNGGKNFMQSLMMLYAILEMLGYGNLLNLTGQVDWYNDRTNDLNVISGEWSAGFANEDEAYAFVGDIEDFVNEVNNAPDGYADQNLIDTVNNSMGLGENGFLGQPTDFYYYDSSTKKYQQANIDYLYNHPNDVVYINVPGQNSSGLHETGDFYLAPKMNNEAFFYTGVNHGSGKQDTLESYKVTDTKGNSLTYADLYDNPTEIVVANGAQMQAAHVFWNYDVNYSYPNQYNANPAAPNAKYTNNGDTAGTGKDELYYTLNTWELDPTSTNPPPPQFQTTQQDINTDITAMTNTASSTSNEVDQESNWIQAVESAMSSAIQSFIEQLNTFIDNDIVS